ncbi:hypothetical protein EV652_108160 [Kribbella steppae]|uniref:Pyrroloquinoline-quinone binding quinoprotein n=1 Tax=Kribbella steppae TaxID=2512223 RepID=A0A4R2HAJ8_9ACTN|nr:hypothetical protein [Kribbella steppae]TCO24628.1 hypothetical protein EV652_108160 [Kribbella steppae]
MAEKIPSWPKVTIRLYDDHNAEVKIAGRSHPVNHHDPRQAAIALVSERAGQLGRPVKATAVESDGASWPLIIHPDGQVEAIDTDARGKKKGEEKPIWPIIVAFVVAGVLIAGTALYLTVFSGGDGVAKPTASPKLPSLPEPKVVPDQFSARPVPLGWTSNASWTVDIAERTVPAVSPNGTEVAVLTPDDKIAVFDSNGKVLWQDKVPNDAESPVYTTIDSKPVLAVVSSDTLYYWAGDGAEATEIELPDSAKVQFFGTSPLVQMGSAGASVVSGGELKTVPNQPRSSTMLLAEGDKALMARYQGPLYWSQPGKDLVTLDLKPPTGAKEIDHVVAASPGRALVLWKSAKTTDLIPAVHSTADGSPVATCLPASKGALDTWDWVPDTARKVAAWGECLIDLSNGKTFYHEGFKPQSIAGTTIYGTAREGLIATTPGRGSYPLPQATARPWGLAGSHAIVVHDSVVFALDKKK